MIDVNIHEKKFKALYDSGSNISLINHNILNQLKINFFNNKKILRTISGQTFSRGSINLPITIGSITKQFTFYVMKHNNFAFQLLLGLDAIKEFKLMQNENLNVFQNKNNINNNNDYICINNIIDEEHDYNPSHEESLNNLLETNAHCFATDKFDVGCVTEAQAQVKLLENKFVTQRPYRCSFEDKREIDKQIQQLLKYNLIEESSSPYAAPITLVYKKEDGKKTRLCVDYRQLNKLVIPECQPFPRIDDIIEKTVNSKYFTVLDINSAFWSIPIKREDRELLAFVTEENQFQWRVLPFGFRNSPSIFQRTLSNILKRNYLNDFSINYIDDIIVFSKSYDEHLSHIQIILSVLYKSGFKLKFEKCKFAKKSVKYLGHVITYNQVKPLSDGLKAILEFPRPMNKKNVRQFLGKVNYYRKFIDNCAWRLEPLHNLLRKNVEFVWSSDCIKAFENLKQLLCCKPVLLIFDHKKEIFIETDASQVGVAAILKQKDDNGILHPVFYFSKKISQTQSKRGAIYIECLAIKEAIIFWQHHLIGREFTVLTDHKPLENLRIKARPDTPLGDLVVFLSQFYFKIIYRKGSKNIEADSLSRNPVLEFFESEELIHTSNLLSLDDIIVDQNKYRDNSLNNDIIKTNNGKILISEKLAIELIKRVHYEFGHIGYNTMVSMISPIYHFQNFHKHIRNFCETCLICLKNKSRIRKPLGFMDKLIKPNKPFQFMSLDTIGGFSGHHSPKRFLHVLTDLFSKFVWIISSTTQCSTDFIKLVKRVSDSHEIGLLMFDRYSGINSKNFRIFLSQTKIPYVMTPRNHPSSNGAVERVGQTLLNRLRCKAHELAGSIAWSNIAETCVSDYNRTRHTVTGFSPCYLLDGCVVDISPYGYMNVKHAKDDQKLEEDRNLAAKNIEKYFIRNKIRLDKKFNDKKLKIGDLVLVDNGNKLNRKKLDCLRIGPFRIIEQISPLMYRVDIGSQRNQANIFHKSQLWPFLEEGRCNDCM